MLGCELSKPLSKIHSLMRPDGRPSLVPELKNSRLMSLTSFSSCFSTSKPLFLRFERILMVSLRHGWKKDRRIFKISSGNTNILRIGFFQPKKKRLLIILLLNLLKSFLLNRFQDLEGAHKRLINAHHGTSIVELAAVIRSREKRY